MAAGPKPVLSAGYAPTFAEIGTAFAFSKVTAFEHVGALVRKGYLDREKGREWRQLRVLFVPEVAHAG